MFQCQHKSCPSHKTNFAFPTMEKKQGVYDKLCIVSWLLSYWWQSRGSLKGSFSFLGLSLISKNSWADNSDLYVTRKHSVFPPRPA